VRQVTRKLTGFWKTSEPEPFYIQHEIRQSGNAWKVDRKGDMGTVSRFRAIRICSSLTIPADDEVLLRYRQ